MPLQLLAACFFCYLSRKRKREDKLLEEAKERDIAEERRKRVERIKKDDIRKKKEKITKGFDELNKIILKNEKEEQKTRKIVSEEIRKEIKETTKIFLEKQKFKECIEWLESIQRNEKYIERYIHLVATEERIFIANVNRIITNMRVYVEQNILDELKETTFKLSQEKRKTEKTHLEKFKKEIIERVIKLLEEEMLKKTLKHLESVYQKHEMFIFLETIEEQIVVAYVSGYISMLKLYVEQGECKVTDAKPFEWKGKKRLTIKETLFYWKKKNMSLPQKEREILINRIKATLKPIILKRENIKYDNDYDNIIVVEVLEGEYSGKYKIEINLPKTEGNLPLMKVFPLVPVEDNEPGTNYTAIIRKILKI